MDRSEATKKNGHMSNLRELTLPITFSIYLYILLYRIEERLKNNRIILSFD